MVCELASPSLSEPKYYYTNIIFCSFYKLPLTMNNSSADGSKDG